MILKKDVFLKIEQQLYNKSLDIDCALFSAIFYNQKEFLLSALFLYRNSDYGFKGSLDNNLYSPLSVPVSTLLMFRYLKMAGYTKDSADELFIDIIEGSKKYLFKKAISKNLWPYTLKENNKYPKASIYSYDENITYKPTSGIVSYLLYFLKEDDIYYDKVVSITKNSIEYFMSNDIFDIYELECFCELYDVIKNMNLIDNILEFKDKLYNKLTNIINKDKKNFIRKYQELSIKLVSVFEEDEFILDFVEECFDFLLGDLKGFFLWESSFKWNNSYSEADIASIKNMGTTTVRILYYLNLYNKIEK